MSTVTCATTAPCGAPSPSVDAQDRPGTGDRADVERRLIERQVAGACRDLGVLARPGRIPDPGSTPQEVATGILDAGDRVEVAQTVLDDALDELALWVDAGRDVRLALEHVHRLAGRPYQRRRPRSPFAGLRASR